MTPFAGFPAAAFEFYDQLEADNSKAFWQANKQVYLDVVKAPMQSLCDALGAYGPFHLFRPYNDVRFAKGRPPYKTHQGAYGESEAGAGYYVHLGTDGFMTGCGYYDMAADQLERFRQAIDDEHRGSELAALVATAEQVGLRPGALSELKTAPRGYPKDHQRITLLRRKGLILSRQWPRAAWMHTPKLTERVLTVWRDAAAVCAWLDTHVGPSTRPPDDNERW